MRTNTDQSPAGPASQPTRRHFISSAAVALAAVSASPRSLALGSPSGGPWSICCLNRPWVKWSLDEMLDGVKAAGFRTLGLQTVSKTNPFIQFGEGKVDCTGILRRLQRADFNGPIWIEACKLGATAATTTPYAKANREFLERALAKI